MNPLALPPRYHLDILFALQQKPMYQGTASPKTVARNRAANKAARIARRANRRG